MDVFYKWVFIGVSGVHDPMVSPIWCMFDHSKERGFVFLALNNSGFPQRWVSVLNVNLCFYFLYLIYFMKFPWLMYGVKELDVYNFHLFFHDFAFWIKCQFNVGI